MVDFLFLPRTDALSSLDPPTLHFLNAAIDNRAASNTSRITKKFVSSPLAQEGPKNHTYERYKLDQKNWLLEQEKLTLRLFFRKTSRKFRNISNRSAVGLAQNLLVPAGEWISEEWTNGLVANTVSYQHTEWAKTVLGLWKSN